MSLLSDLGPNDFRPEGREQDEHLGGEPPYDGSDPCPACPWVVRMLYDAAVRAVDVLESNSFQERRTMQALEDAIRLMEPYIEAHFANEAHAFGPDFPPQE